MTKNTTPGNNEKMINESPVEPKELTLEESKKVIENNSSLNHVLSSLGVNPLNKK